MTPTIIETAFLAVCGITVLCTVYSWDQGTTVTEGPEEELCECSCEFYDKMIKWEEKAAEETKQNKTQEEKIAEVKTEMKATKEKLAVNTSSLSSNVRKKKSAQDTRTSAVGIGYLGAVLIGFVFASVIFCDLLSIQKHVHTMKKGIFKVGKKKIKSK